MTRLCTTVQKRLPRIDHSELFFWLALAAPSPSSFTLSASLLEPSPLFFGKCTHLGCLVPSWCGRARKLPRGSVKDPLREPVWLRVCLCGVQWTSGLTPVFPSCSLGSIMNANNGKRLLSVTTTFALEPDGAAVGAQG